MKKQFISKDTQEKLRSITLPMLTILTAIGNPVFFLIMLYIEGKGGTFHDITTILWNRDPVTKDIRLWNFNVWFFYTVLLYSIWLVLYIYILNAFRKINILRLLEEKLIIACVINIPLLIKAYIWTNFGQQHDIIAFVFMLMLSLLLLVIMSIALLLRYAFGAYDVMNKAKKSMHFICLSAIFILAIYLYFYKIIFSI